MNVGRRASEQTRSYIQEEITEGDVEEWILGEVVVDVDGPERTYKQVFWALFGADQGRRDEEYTVDLCTKCFLA